MKRQLIAAALAALFVAPVLASPPAGSQSASGDIRTLEKVPVLAADQPISVSDIAAFTGVEPEVLRMMFGLRSTAAYTPMQHTQARNDWRQAVAQLADEGILVQVRHDHLEVRRAGEPADKVALIIPIERR